MIVRVWRAVARPERSDGYFEFWRERGLEDYRAVAGNRGIQVLRRTTPGGIEWLMLTKWEDWAAVRAFAGDDPEIARYRPGDEEFFNELPEPVEHYDLMFEETDGGTGSWPR
jgi:heme-degrading monooxygenase HmoA